MEFIGFTRRSLQRNFVVFAVSAIVFLGYLKESTAQSILIIEEPADTKVIAGSPVTLNCTAKSSSSFKYIWQFDGDRIYSDSRRTIQSDGTLQFQKTEIKDQGEYVCIARITGSRTRAKSRKAVLTVQSICTASSLQLIPDRLQHATGASVQMDCKCSNSQPKATITWFKDNSKLSTGGDITISSNQLSISNLKISDSGSYHCNATNVLGKKQSPSKKIEVLNAVRPAFEPKPPSRIFAKKKSNLKLDCKATGQPAPMIKWFYGSQRDALTTNAKHTLGSDGSLTINNVESSDFESYKCEASNFLGSIAAEVTVSKAYIKNFDYKSSIRYAEVGEQFSLTCNPGGGPAPTVTWKSSNGGPLPSSYIASKDTLFVNQVKSSDSANITCEATNIAGTRKTEFRVTAAEYPTFAAQPLHSVANENSKTKLECSVSTTLPLQVTWAKNGETVVPDSYHKVNSQYALVFKKVSKKDEGVYKCYVNTPAKSLQSRSANLTVNAAVKLSGYNMNHHKFNMGTEARIYCSFKGAGPVTVSWQKKGQKSMGGNIIPHGEKLTIKDIAMKDAGIYVCTGKNAFSNDSAGVNVSVFIYPQFVVKPHNVTAEEFGSFWVHCNATGYPKPKITFSKEALGGDNLPPRFKQFENGSMHIEKILPEDRGNYYCIAANTANLNQVTFSLRVVVPPNTNAGSKESTMGRTIAIAVGCAAAYIVLVVGLMIYCKRRRAKQQKKAEQLTIDAEGDHAEADPEMPLQPVNGKPAGYNKMEFPRHDLEALRTLGNGSYGRAFLSRASGIKDGERETMVVVKSLMSTDEIQKEDFWRELNALVKMDNPHVMALLGVCRDIAPQYMIFEYLEKGDLKQYLLSCYENGRSTLTSSQKLSICSNIVSGMSYLSSNNFVHKDIAARNCMVTKDLQVKIGFLSLSYDLYSSEYYRFNNMLIPLRWMAPEAIFNDEFSEKSDVWSYGVLVWEIYTMGQTPFDDRSDEEVLKCVKEDLRLSKPDNCPDTMANVMKKCWGSNPDDRPPFEKLYAEVSEIAVDTHL